VLGGRLTRKGLLMTAVYDVHALYLDLFEGVDETTARRVASNFGNDAHEGREANRRDVELALLLATKTISPQEFQALAFAELGIDRIASSREGF
jgi:hypothetical protein